MFHFLILNHRRHRGDHQAAAQDGSPHSLHRVQGDRAVLEPDAGRVRAGGGGDEIPVLSSRVHSRSARNLAFPPPLR